MLLLNNFSFAYDDKEPLFNKVCTEIETNSLTLLCGANGSGKTTICRILSGLEKNYTGEIKVNDLELKKASTVNLADQLIYLKQEPMANIVATTPCEDLDIWLNRFSAKKDNSRDIYEALTRFSLESYKDTHIWELSSGQIKRVGLAAVSLFPQKFWILDEPTSGLDSGLIKSFIELLRTRTEQGLGTMIVTHRLDLFQEIDHKILEIKKKDIIDL